MVIAWLLIATSPAHAGWALETSPSGERQWLTLKADAEVVGGRDVHSLPELVVDCTRKKLTVYIRTPGLRPELNADLYDDFMAMTRQALDAEPAANQYMRKDIMEEALHYRKARKQLSELRSHAQLRFAFQPFGSGAVETTFALDGLEEALTSLHPRCTK